MYPDTNECSAATAIGAYVPTDEDRRNAALHFAIEANPDRHHTEIIDAAKAFEAYLKGETPKVASKAPREWVFGSPYFGAYTPL